MNEFDGIENAQTNAKLPHIVPGRYVLKVEALKKVKSRKGQTYLCLEALVKQRLSESGNEQGSHCSLMMNTALDNFLSNAKNLFAAVVGKAESAITKDLAESLTSDANPGAGKLIEAEASNIVTRAGKDFTLVRFSPYTAKDR